MTAVPPPAPENFDQAAQIFDSRKPIGTRIAGIAIVIGAQILWSVNYEVDADQFPVPTATNRDKARAKFQSVQPTNAAVVQCSVCQIKPGGLVLSKWQITYSVKMRAAARSKTPEGRPEVKTKSPVREKRTPKESETPQAHSSHLLNKLLLNIEEEKKRTVSLAARFQDLFITKKTVDRVTSREARRWMSKSKSNVVHALKRIMRKGQADKASPAPKHIKFVSAGNMMPPAAPVAKESPPANPPTMNAELQDPAKLYKAIEKTGLVAKIKAARQDKIAICASLLHVASCRKEKPDEACQRSAYWLHSYDILQVPTYQEVRQICIDLRLDPVAVRQTKLSPRLEIHELNSFYQAGVSLCQ